jgi:hypothetical protein
MREMAEKDTNETENDTNSGAETERHLPHATEKKSDDEKPPLYISGFGVMGQSSPDVATGSTPVTRKDD